MSSQHLSDEAVAAAADGVLSGHARDRAMRHVASCAECAHAVKVQREAAWALRAAPPPALPFGLLDRLRTVAGDGDAPLPTAWPNEHTGTYLPIAAPIAALVPKDGERRRLSFPTGLFRSGER